MILHGQAVFGAATVILRGNMSIWPRFLNEAKSNVALL